MGHPGHVRESRVGRPLLQGQRWDVGVAALSVPAGDLACRGARGGTSSADGEGARQTLGYQPVEDGPSRRWKFEILRGGGRGLAADGQRGDQPTGRATAAPSCARVNGLPIKRPRHEGRGAQRAFFCSGASRHRTYIQLMRRAHTVDRPAISPTQARWGGPERGETPAHGEPFWIRAVHI